jgi:phosphonopyruvate decarboxylase
MLMIIGWRGAPKTKDEPQHVAKGKITLKLLKLLGIDHCILENKNDLVKLEKIIKRSKKFNRPVACLIKNKTLKTRIKVTTLKKNMNNSLLRKDLILNLLNCINKNDDIISTTGFTSRELNQLRKLNNLKKEKIFIWSVAWVMLPLFH